MKSAINVLYISVSVSIKMRMSTLGIGAEIIYTQALTWLSTSYYWYGTYLKIQLIKFFKQESDLEAFVIYIRLYMMCFSETWDGFTCPLCACVLLSRRVYHQWLPKNTPYAVFQHPLKTLKSLECNLCLSNPLNRIQNPWKTYNP